MALVYNRKMKRWRAKFLKVTLPDAPIEYLVVPCTGQASGFPSTKLVRMREITSSVLPSPISSANIPKIKGKMIITRKKKHWLNFRDVGG